MQGRSLLDFKCQVEVTHKDLAFIRNHGVKEYFSLCFEYAVEMTSLTDIVPSMPRIAVCQQHRENEESDRPSTYYRKNICLLCLGHLINGIDVPFEKYGKTVLKMKTLIPRVIAERDVTNDDIVEI